MTLVLAAAAYMVACALIDTGRMLDRWAYRRRQRPRAIETYTNAPSGWELPTQPIALAGSPGTRPCDPSASLTGDGDRRPAGSPTVPLAAIPPRSPAAAVPQPLPPGAVPVDGPARPRRGRHASGRVLWFPWAAPALEVAA